MRGLNMQRRDADWTLAAWREADRAAREAELGSPEWKLARGEAIRSRDRYRAAADRTARSRSGAATRSGVTTRG
jgi:hypothetical protein